MSEKTHHVAKKKKDIAKNIQKLILEYPIIAAVNMENLPAPQLQQMRSQLRGKIELTMTKRRIIKHAIDGIKDKKKNIEKLEPHLKGMPALIFTKENPFSLFKTLKKSKTNAPAKANQTAPFDLIVPKGPTSFAPGPVIGELAVLGIKSGVEDGKVAIKEDSVVVKEGEKISAKAAEILTRLGVEPMEVGLNVTAVYENGEIFTADILDIDEEKFMSDLQSAARGAFNLAINSAYSTKDTINTLIGKAFNDAKAIGLSQNIIDEGIIDQLLGKAENAALSLKSTAKIETVEKPKEEKEEKPKEEAKVEEKKDEPKPEVKETPAPKEEKPKDEPTPSEKKEEKVLEEEKEIIKEEKKLEQDARKPKIEAPVEKEVREEVKEEEEKQLEKQRIEKEKELEKIQEQKKAEDEKRKQEEVKRKEAQQKKAEDEKRKSQEEARKRAEEQKKAEEEKRKAQEEAQRKTEEEKKILEEEKRLEQEAKKPKIEAPVEKEVREAVVEEEEKQLEKEKPQDDTDKKIAEMVAKTKKFVKGDIPNADKLIEDANKSIAQEVKGEPKKQEAPKAEEKTPTIQDLKELQTKREYTEKTEKKKKEQEEVEKLAQELIKKGTLRK